MLTKRCHLWQKKTSTNASTNARKKTTYWFCTGKDFWLSQLDVVLSDPDLLFCTRKTLKSQNQKHIKILVLSLKHYTIEKFKEIHFSDYVRYTSVSVICSNFVNKFVGAINHVALIKKVRVRTNSKSEFDVEIISVIERRDKPCSR